MRGTLLRARYRRWLGPAIVILTLLAASLLQSLASPRTATAQAPALPRISAVYLAGPIKPGLDVDRARAYGIRVVSSVADLTSAAPTVAAIVIDGRYFDRVDPGWLAEQLAAGRVIAGIDVPSARLEGIRGYRRPSHPDMLVQDWGGHPFYSLVYQWHDANGALQVGAGSDRIQSRDGFFARLYVAVDGSPLQAALSGR